MNNNSDAAPLFFAIFFVVTAGMVVGAALYFRHQRRELEHRERMAALDKGMAIPELARTASTPWTPRAYLLRGLINLFVGIALFLLVGGIVVSVQHQPTIESRVREAMWAKNAGANEDQVKAIMNDTERRDGPPPALALIGLIPIGIGLAFLITYRLETKAVQNLK